MQDAKQSNPYSIRFNEDDNRMLAFLTERLGLKVPQVLRLALRRLYQTEKKKE